MIMDSNYSWSQPEHNGPAQKIWSTAHIDILTSKLIKQSSTNLHNYPYFQNELPIYSTVPLLIKDAWHNPPYRIEDCALPTNNKEENYKINDRKESLSDQVLEFIKRKRDYNKASTFGYEIQLQYQMISTVKKDIYPWNVKKRIYQKNMDGLHEEILDFYQYIMPTVEEKRMRQEVVARLKNVVLREWPDADVDVFGSFKTELHLPTSDIDVVIFGKWDDPLWTLNNIIKKSGIASDCKVLDRATVPIVKMTDKETEVRIDISFNMPNGIRSADLIKSFIKEFPQLPQLVLVLKQYLLQRDLNEVWTGGISSYSLILMCVSFMKLRATKKSNNQENLGEILILFLELYGRNFDYFNTGIRTEGDSCHVPKEDLLKNMEGNHWSSILCIEDPLNPGNDIGRSSYGALHIKLAFDYAFTTLSRVVLPQSAHLFQEDMSILGRIIRITPEVMKYRAFIKNKFSQKISSEEPSVFNNGTTVTSDNGQSVNQESTQILTEPKKDPNTNNSNQKPLPKCNINEQGDVPNRQDVSYSTVVVNPKRSLKSNTIKKFTQPSTINHYELSVSPSPKSKPPVLKTTTNTSNNTPANPVAATNHQHHSISLKKNELSDFTNKHSKKTKVTIPVSNGIK